MSFLLKYPFLCVLCEPIGRRKSCRRSLSVTKDGKWRRSSGRRNATAATHLDEAGGEGVGGRARGLVGGGWGWGAGGWDGVGPRGILLV